MRNDFICVVFWERKDFKRQEAGQWMPIQGGDMGRDSLQKGMSKLFGVMERFCISCVVVVKWLHTFVKSYQTLYLESMYFTVCKLGLNKLDLKVKKLLYLKIYQFSPVILSVKRLRSWEVSEVSIFHIYSIYQGSHSRFPTLGTGLYEQAWQRVFHDYFHDMLRSQTSQPGLEPFLCPRRVGTSILTSHLRAVYKSLQDSEGSSICYRVWPTGKGSPSRLTTWASWYKTSDFSVAGKTVVTFTGHNDIL